MPVCVWHGCVQCVAVWPWMCVCAAWVQCCARGWCACACVCVGWVGVEQNGQEDRLLARLPPHCLENREELSLLYGGCGSHLFTSERGQDA